MIAIYFILFLFFRICLQNYLFDGALLIRSKSDRHADGFSLTMISLIIWAQALGSA